MHPVLHPIIRCVWWTWSNTIFVEKSLHAERYRDDFFKQNLQKFWLVWMDIFCIPIWQNISGRFPDSLPTLATLYEVVMCIWGNQTRLTLSCIEKLELSIIALSVFLIKKKKNIGLSVISKTYSSGFDIIWGPGFDLLKTIYCSPSASTSPMSINL